MNKLILIFTLLIQVIFIAFDTFSQTIDTAKTNKEPIVRRTNWKNITVIEMDTSETIYRSLTKKCIGGEWTLDTWQNVRAMPDLTKKNLRKIKKMVSKHSGKIVFIDARHIIDIGAGEKTVYFLWVNCKPAL